MKGLPSPEAEEGQWLEAWASGAAILEAGDADGPLSPHSSLEVGLPDQMQCV